jgi:hypothetical protein
MYRKLCTVKFHYDTQYICLSMIHDGPTTFAVTLLFLIDFELKLEIDLDFEKYFINRLIWEYNF